MAAMGIITKFTNCRILRDHKIFWEDLWVRDGKVIDPLKLFYVEKKHYDRVVDLEGALVSPGFIDLQINGGFGVDFSHDLLKDPSGLDKVAKGILAHGVTSFCPTIVTSKAHVYQRILPLLKRRKGGIWGAEILGAHVEGPFISAEKKGAHSEADICEFENEISTVQQIYGDLNNIMIVTLAPEKKNALKVVNALSSQGIVVSVGHSMASYVVAEEAVLNGANLITHLFNAMLPFHHRDPGIVGLLGMDSKSTVYYGVIADGIHTHHSTLRIAYKSHPEGVVLVTDAISAMGLGDGNHYLGEKVIQIKNGRACIAGTSTLCGSVATMIDCISHFIRAIRCPLVEALEAASMHPAAVLGLETKKGTLNYGSDADFVVLDDSLSILSTWIRGECVYSKKTEK
ncbi:N-acetylglucosamine-6-phosphate deacetylase isoform X1 [Cimex lectularius]|uniref:N-acetylglucosamine-6-phosphate deacetylase n=1 Tax=Cimex lectularius TaxID=79782 RepID=A0A8I6SH89_CIMLE|nr:N-acetylglucosamine-6-phosphate deacetylase isoform X1 [Cimex lectularius]